MAEWEYKTVNQGPPGPFRKVEVCEQEVQTTLEETVRDLRKKGWVKDSVWEHSRGRVPNIEELGCWDRIAQYQLKRKKEDSD